MLLNQNKNVNIQYVGKGVNMGCYSLRISKGHLGFMFSATSTHPTHEIPRFHFAALQVSHRADQTARAQKKEETCEEFS